MSEFKVGDRAIIVRADSIRCGMECTIISGLEYCEGRIRSIDGTIDSGHGYCIELSTGEKRGTNGLELFFYPHELRKLPPKDEQSEFTFEQLIQWCNRETA